MNNDPARVLRHQSLRALPTDSTFPINCDRLVSLLADVTVGRGERPEQAASVMSMQLLFGN
jgi:hypothetical protein